MEFVTNTHYYTGDGWDFLRMAGIFAFAILTVLFVWYAFEEHEPFAYIPGVIGLLAVISCIWGMASVDGGRQADLTNDFAAHGITDIGFGKNMTTIGTKDGKLVYCKSLDLDIGNKYIIKCFDNKDQVDIAH